MIGRILAHLYKKRKCFLVGLGLPGSEVELQLLYEVLELGEYRLLVCWGHVRDGGADVLDSELGKSLGGDKMHELCRMERLELLCDLTSIPKS